MAAKSNKEIRNVVEAALLASEVPLSVRKIQNLFEEDARPESKEINKALKDLEDNCDGRGIELCKIGKGYRFQTRERYAPWMRRLRETRPPRYSRALLETMSIVAYRQPVTRGDIESIRGVAVSSDIMRVLLDREWVSQVGHRDVPGRPALYGTTSAFLEYFNLRTLSDLPALIEPRDLNEVAAELNITLPQESDVVGARDRDVIDAENDSNDEEDDDLDSDDLDARLDERRDKAEAEIAASLEAIDAELATIPKIDKKVIAALAGEDVDGQPVQPGGTSVTDPTETTDAADSESTSGTESETTAEQDEHEPDAVAVAATENVSDPEPTDGEVPASAEPDEVETDEVEADEVETDQADTAEVGTQEVVTDDGEHTDAEATVCDSRDLEENLADANAPEFTVVESAISAIDEADSDDVSADEGVVSDTAENDSNDASHAIAGVAIGAMTDAAATTIETVMTPLLSGSRNVDGEEAQDDDPTAEPSTQLIDDDAVSQALLGGSGDFDDELDSVLPARPVVHTVYSSDEDREDAADPEVDKDDGTDDAIDHEIDDGSNNL